MPAKVVSPDQLWPAVRFLIENVKQDFAAEIGGEIVERTPIDTGRLIKSVNLNNGQNPKKQDRYRPPESEGPRGGTVYKKEGNPNGLRSKKKAAIRRQSRKRVANGKPWWIVASAPYASYVNKMPSVNSGRVHFMKITGTDVANARKKALKTGYKRR